MNSTVTERFQNLNRRRIWSWPTVYAVSTRSYLSNQQNDKASYDLRDNASVKNYAGKCTMMATGFACSLSDKGGAAGYTNWVLRLNQATHKRSHEKEIKERELK